MAKKQAKLDYLLLHDVQTFMHKKAFVPMPGGQGEPVAGASDMTAGLAGPMGGDPSMGGGMPPMDPAAAGGMPPMDPAAMGGAPAGAPPMDPAAAGGMPPMDPAAMAALGGLGGAPSGQVTMSIQELIQLIEAIKGISGGGDGAKPKGSGKADVNGKLDQILAAVSGAPAPAPAAPPAQ